MSIHAVQTKLENESEAVYVQYLKPPYHLTGSEKRMLGLLIKFDGKVVTHEMFLRELYDGPGNADEKIIDVFMCKARKKLKDPRCIKLVWGRGYRWADPLQESIATPKPFVSLNRRGSVVGPGGSLLTIANLPKEPDVRWSVRRKAEVVTAIKGKLLTFNEASEAYHLSREEYFGWVRNLAKFGATGLRTTRTRQYMDTET